jgi:hypothetical protein
VSEAKMAVPFVTSSPDPEVPAKAQRRQNQHLQEELEKAHIVIDVQKKVAKLLGYPIAEVPHEEK